MNFDLSNNSKTYISSNTSIEPKEIIKTDEFKELLNQLPDHTTSIQTAATLTGIKIGCITTIPENNKEEILENLRKLNISYHKIFNQLLFTRNRDHIQNHLQKLDKTELTERYTPLAPTEEDIGIFIGVPDDDLLWWEDYENPPKPDEYSTHLETKPNNWEKRYLIHDTGIQIKPQPKKESIQNLIQRARIQKQLSLYLYDEHDITSPINKLLENQQQRIQN